jgi:hypothetical protein
VRDERMGSGGFEGCEGAENTFRHGRAADVSEADEEDGDGFSVRRR